MNIFVYGTTAELIKIFPIFSRLDRAEYVLISTGQQPEGLSNLERVMAVKPDYSFRNAADLPLTKVYQVLIWSIRTSIKLVRLLSDSKFDKKKSTVIVHGDTITSTLAAFFGFLFRFRIAHIEAGLRSRDLLNPFPEEIDRIITSFFATLHFAPGETAVKNLVGKRGEVINTHFNTVVDALLDVPKVSPQGLDLPGEFALVCLHRTELLSNKSVLGQTLMTLNKISQRIHVVMVIDPLTEFNLRHQANYLLLEESRLVTIVRKLVYPEFQYLMQNCEFLVTDSGGQQEEAAQLGLPCIVHRRATERFEGLDANVVLSLWSQAALVSFADDYSQYRRPLKVINRSPSDIIVDRLRLVDLD